MRAYKILRVHEEPAFIDGKPVPTIRVEFMIDDDGPFFEHFLKAEYTDRVVRERLGDFAETVRRARTP